MQTVLKPQRFLIQLFDLTLVQLSSWRWSWRGMLITGTLTPLLSILALGTFSRQSGPEALGYILTGNVVLALMFNNQNRVASNFAFMHARGMLSYFATLPIHNASLVLATVIAFFLLSLPSVFVTMFLGTLFLGLQVTLHPLLGLVLLLSAAPTSSLGALIGSNARSPEEAGSLSLLTTFVLMGLGPVLLPPQSLPQFMLSLGYLSPATYAASALRQTLLGPVTGRIALDLAVLAVLSILIPWLVGRTMAWRCSQT